MDTKRVLFFLFFVSFFLSLPSFAKRFTYGFHLAKMRLEFPFHAEWEGDSSLNVVPLLQQPFYFLGKGAQCYVFEGQDRQTVIKLFRYDKIPTEAKILHLFNACKLAYDQLREETGLLYIHLNPTHDQLPILSCRDPVGRSIQLPLDQYRFVLQKKAQPFRSTFFEALQDSSLMQKRIDAFVSLLSSRVSKQIMNTDPNLSRNFGFLGERAVELDFGNYRYVADLDQKEEIEKYAKKLRRWLELNAPEWALYLDQKIEHLPVF